MNRILLYGLVLATVAATLTVNVDEALAQDDESLRPYSSLVVQNRQFIQRHEITGAVGALPLDAFTKGLTVSAGYTLHFSELMAWEVAQFHYSFHLDTRLRGQLEALQIFPSPFEVLNYYVTSNAVFKPLYWKGSWLNDSLQHGELFLTVGGAYGWFTRSVRPGMSLGAGLRFFAGERVSFRFDLRYLLFPDDQFLQDLSFKDEIAVGIGTSLGF